MGLYNSITVLGRCVKKYSESIKVKILKYTQCLNYPNCEELELLENTDISEFDNMYVATPGHHICGATIDKGKELRLRISELLNSDFENMFNTYFDWLILKLYLKMVEENLV